MEKKFIIERFTKQYSYLRYVINTIYALAYLNVCLFIFRYATHELETRASGAKITQIEIQKEIKLQNYSN